MAGEPKKFFSNQFIVTEDDRLILTFFERKFTELFTRLTKLGYSKDAIADGVIHAITLWRNRP